MPKDFSFDNKKQLLLKYSFIEYGVSQMRYAVFRIYHNFIKLYQICLQGIKIVI